MRLSDFDYSLPKELIAQYPQGERDKARLLILDRKQGTIEHRIFKDILDYFKKDDLLVLNNTKVLPSRLIGSRITGGKVEVLLLDRKADQAFNALIKPNRIKAGEKIIFTPPLRVRAGFNGGSVLGTVNARNEITFSCQDIDRVYNLGMMPLPPYIKREPEELDNIYYQTVYAKEPGAVAAPTAGLHFTKDLIKKVESLGIKTAYVTLHIGYATFKPVTTEDVAEHKMGREYFQINDEAIALLKQIGPKGSRIFAVGTTSCRALETYALGRKEGYTDLFIYPGYKFKMADCLITNFHLPKTTLFMLVSAFAGEKLIKKAYQEAIDKKYRFYSYGDAMLII